MRLLIIAVQVLLGNLYLGAEVREGSGPCNSPLGKLTSQVPRAESSLLPEALVGILFLFPVTQPWDP